MKKIIFILIIFILIICGCKHETKTEDAMDVSEYIKLQNQNDIIIGGRNFAKTDFVTVIPKGQIAVIPSGNCKPINDVFLDTRTITLSPFAMSKFEVTQELYNYIMSANPYPDSENVYEDEIQILRPIVGINWFEAVIFCNKLSQMCGLECVYTITDIKESGKSKGKPYVSSAKVEWDLTKNGYRLPTEAEWEYAARGGGKSQQDWEYKYSGSDNVKKVAWTSMTSSGYSDDDDKMRTHQVGLKAPNAFDIYDMSGNVSEWCMDWYRSVSEDGVYDKGNAVKDSGPVTNPILKKGKYDNHVVRGGCFTDSNGMALNSQRNSYPAYTCYNSTDTAQVGIRLVRLP